jgi:16S rRNA A1518/A1519 N6-dimethyltransferase RsmA/KsgA/DIM1 with predicted DNA glycosylase/AP lyase activity
VRTAFGKRRKTLRNSLAYLPAEEEVLAAALAKIEFPLDKRPEELPPGEFVALAQKLAPFLQHSSPSGQH